MTITRTCLTASVILAENCTKGIHQLENKRSNLHKLLLLKLALSLEQTTSFAKLAFEIQLLEENQGCKPVFYAMICNAIRCFRSALTDTDIQVSRSYFKWCFCSLDSVHNLSTAGPSNWVANTERRANKENQFGVLILRILCWGTCWRPWVCNPETL